MRVPVKEGSAWETRLGGMSVEEDVCGEDVRGKDVWEGVLEGYR